MNNENFNKVLKIISKSKQIVAFTGAGISVSSGIPSFRGDEGIWEKYNPESLEINFFLNNPKSSWNVIKELFYHKFANANPNPAHFALFHLERSRTLRSIITQNIDNLHFLAGNKNIFEFHGNSRELVCMNCKEIFLKEQINLSQEIPSCPKCKGLLKPNFTFFGEDINTKVYNGAMREAQMADTFLIIGTSGKVMPASIIPHTAKEYGSIIVEINKSKSTFTDSITDFYLEGQAEKILYELVNNIK